MATRYYLSSLLKKPMIVVTGAEGFIGSCLISDLIKVGHHDIVAVDHFNNPAKNKNLAGKRIREKIVAEKLFPWLDENGRSVEAIYHFGAITDTMATSVELFDKYNLNYSKEIWEKATRDNIKLIYASSAATYGNGTHGYSDDHQLLTRLQPLNAYANSKHQFDLWAIAQTEAPDFWAGLKFFNVFGPNEYHKGRMASMVFQGFDQIRSTGKVRLFKSFDDRVGHGEQKRDFIYVKDVTGFCLRLLGKNHIQGLINVGSGQAVSFNLVVSTLFDAMKLPSVVEYIDMPSSLRSKYQNFTEADLSKTERMGEKISGYSLEDAITEYVERYLLKRLYL